DVGIVVGPRTLWQFGRISRDIPRGGDVFHLVLEAVEVADHLADQPAADFVLQRSHRDFDLSPIRSSLRRCRRRADYAAQRNQTNRHAPPFTDGRFIARSILSMFAHTGASRVHPEYRIKFYGSVSAGSRWLSVMYSLQRAQMCRTRKKSL